MSSNRKYNNKPRWRINADIRASQLRVIAEDKQLGVLPREEALEKAKKLELDLVEIAPKANPPVAKIIDFGKFRYQEEKKERAAKKKVKTTEVKEVRFSPFIADGDFQTRMARVKEFLGEKNKVRVVVVFKGRQMGSKPFGYKLMERVLAELEDTVSVDMAPKFLGRHLAMVISPLNKSIKKNEENKNENQKKRDKAL